MEKRKKPQSEKTLLKDLDEHTAHADALAQPRPQEWGETDPLTHVFAYRVFDLRDRFPAPLPTFRQALECLFSEQAYLPELSAEILAYLRDGRSIPIPSAFLIEEQPWFESREAAEAWVNKRAAEIQAGDRFAAVSGIGIANPDDPFEKQVADALAYREAHLIAQASIDRVCDKVAHWLRAAIESTHQ